MGIGAPKMAFKKKGFRGFSGFKISKSEALKMAFLPIVLPLNFPLRMVGLNFSQSFMSSP